LGTLDFLVRHDRSGFRDMKPFLIGVAVGAAVIAGAALILFAGRVI
jgi:hypothetical protein